MTAPSALITGITGQDGSYLAELLLDKGYEVVGMVRRSSTTNFERIAHLQDRLILDPYTSSGDLLDEASLISILREYRPAEVYNLAAQSFVQTSFTQPVLTGEITALGVTRLLDAIRIVDPEHPLLPGQLERDVRQGAGGAADARARRSTPARPTAWPRSTATGSRSTTASPTASTRRPGSSSTTSRPRRGLEFVPRKVSHGVAQIKLGLADGAAPRQPRRRARLGLRRRLRRGDVADAPAGRARRLRRRHRRDALGARASARSPSSTSASTGRTTSSIDEKFIRPAEVDLLIGDPTQGREDARLAADARRSRSSSR